MCHNFQKILDLWHINEKILRLELYIGCLHKQVIRAEPNIRKGHVGFIFSINVAFAFQLEMFG